MSDLIERLEREAELHYRAGMVFSTPPACGPLLVEAKAEIERLNWVNSSLCAAIAKMLQGLQAVDDELELGIITPEQRAHFKRLREGK